HGGARQLGDVGAGSELVPVEGAVGHEVSAAVEEPLGEHAAPDVPPARITEQQLAGRIGAVHGRRAEVVPGGPVDVQDDGAESERFGRGAGDGGEEMVELVSGAD